MRVSKPSLLLVVGPIILSAFSILVTFLILQPFALFLDPTFNLLANKGIGKIAFTILAIFQIILLICVQSKVFLKEFFKTNFLFLIQKNWIKTFFSYFILFFILHSLILSIFYFAGFMQYNPLWGNFSLSLIYKTLFGFVATFFLAWTEELIFRGTIYPYLNQRLSVFSSLIITSFIFMSVHDLHNPINLITKNWDLGLGLFLLGIILNLIFISTGKLYTGMGAHAGLVFVKVLLRRAPFVIFLPNELLPFWINKDLRMSVLTHLLFLILIIFFFIKNKDKIFNKKI